MLPLRVSVAEAPERLGASVVLDVRDAASFAAGHVPGSGQLTVPEFELRRHELPTSKTPVLVVAASAPEAEHAARALCALSYTAVAWLDGPVTALEPRGWSREAAARMWRPAPFLESVIAGIPRGRALDLACGAGREAIYLAQMGFTVEAWDNDPGALERCTDLARRSGVAVETVRRDLERDVTLPESRYALVTCFRFLHRPLFDAMRAALAPGGHLVYETFRVGQEQYGRPKHARYLLESGELAQAFETLEILSYEEPSPPGGPVLARLHARRR